MSHLAFGGFLLLIERCPSLSAVSVAFHGLGLASVGGIDIFSSTSMNPWLGFSVFISCCFFCHSVISSLKYPDLRNPIK